VARPISRFLLPIRDKGCPTLCGAKAGLNNGRCRKVCVVSTLPVKRHFNPGSSPELPKASTCCRRQPFLAARRRDYPAGGEESLGSAALTTRAKGLGYAGTALMLEANRSRRKLPDWWAHQAAAGATLPALSEKLSVQNGETKGHRLCLSY
jgi:hypothetical protein